MTIRILKSSLFVASFAIAAWVAFTPPLYASPKPYIPLAPIDVAGSELTSTGPYSECKAPTCFPRYLRTIFNIGVGMAGLFAVFSIVRGGFTLMFTDSILGHSEAKGIILRAVGGLIVVYSSYIFMNQISPSLGRELDLSLAFEKVTVKKETGGLAVIEGDTPAERYGRELDKLLADLIEENKKPNIVDAKRARGMAQDAAAAIKKLGEELQDPELTQAERDAKRTTKAALETARATLLTKTGDAKVLAVNATLSTFLAGLKNEMDEASSIPAQSRIYAAGVTRLREIHDIIVLEMQSDGVPQEKINSVTASYKANGKALCLHKNSKVSAKYQSDCTIWD